MTASELLPPVRGKWREKAVLAETNWFQVGGPADVLFRPEDADDLAVFMRWNQGRLPVLPIGVGSNLLVRDGGVEGVVIRLGRGFTEMRVEERDGVPHVYLGAAVLDRQAALFAQSHDISGLEFLIGVPGTIGGAVAMNAGAYGSEMVQVLSEVAMVLAEGKQVTVAASEIPMQYRKAHLPEGAIVTGAWLKAAYGDREVIAQRMREIVTSREATQPIRERTGGSTFKNPEGHKAWQLIDAAGCRGLTIGGAQISELHCNFLINTGAATAADLEMLGEEVRRRVKEQANITLEWEIKRVGKDAE